VIFYRPASLLSYRSYFIGQPALLSYRSYFIAQHALLSYRSYFIGQPPFSPTDHILCTGHPNPALAPLSAFFLRTLLNIHIKHV
jgi:hypothetical protein